MVFHPRNRWPWNKEMSRRDMLRVTAGGAVAAGILAACGGNGGSSGSASSSGITIGTPSNPVKQPLFDDNPPIDSGLEPEPGPLRLFNWADYIWAPVIKDFEKEFDVEVELTTFYNLEGATKKLRTGEVNFDVFFPTAEVIPKFVAGKLFQPLNLDYIPNLKKNVIEKVANPYYDLGSQYTVPYVLYQTGISWRTDLIEDDLAAMDNPWEAFWNPDYKNIVGLYDDYRETVGVGMYKSGLNDQINSANPEVLEEVKNNLTELVDLVNIRYTIDGVYQGLPEEKFGIHHSWSGDVVNAQYYFPKGGDPSVLRYLWPPKAASGTAGGYISNDSLAVLKGADNPVLAHMFLNFMLDQKHGMKNFSWLGYQPPFKSIEPATLVKDGWVPEALDTAIIKESDFNLGQAPVQLTPTEDKAWLDTWSEVQASS
jgi:spermidine/putrescine transport system substrate-binding protein